MNNNSYSKHFHVLLLFLFLSSIALSRAAAKTPERPCYTNYTLDNGELLLGNNDYPAISYSGYRTRTRSAENCPSVEEIKEDMKFSQRWESNC